MACALHRHRLVGQRMPAIASERQENPSDPPNPREERAVHQLRVPCTELPEEKDMTKLSEKSQELVAAGLGVSMTQKAAAISEAVVISFHRVETTLNA